MHPSKPRNAASLIALLLGLSAALSRQLGPEVAVRLSAAPLSSEAVLEAGQLARAKHVLQWRSPASELGREWQALGDGDRTLHDGAAQGNGDRTLHDGASLGAPKTSSPRDKRQTGAPFRWISSGDRLVKAFANH